MNLNLIIVHHSQLKHNFSIHSGKYKMEEEKGRPAFYNKLMKLHIYNITHEDLGTYRCLAKNSQGETSGEIELYGESGSSISNH